MMKYFNFFATNQTIIYQKQRIFVQRRAKVWFFSQAFNKITEYDFNINCGIKSGFMVSYINFLNFYLYLLYDFNNNLIICCSAKCSSENLR